MKGRVLIPVFLLFLQAIAASGDESFFSVPVENISPEAYLLPRCSYLLFSSDEHFSLPDTPFQKVVSSRKSDGGIEVVVLSGENLACKKSGRSFLEDTRLLGIRSPEIQAIKAKFTASRDPVGEVTKFVYGHITRKIEGVPIISAREVLRSRTGDCTEHTVLTVALLRSLGVPSRAAVGMVLCERFGRYRDVFVFHMWAEAYRGGRWVLADATRPGEYNPGRYIAFGYHSLRAEMPLEYLRAVSAIRDLRVGYMGR